MKWDYKKKTYFRAFYTSCPFHIFDRIIRIVPQNPRSCPYNFLQFATVEIQQYAVRMFPGATLQCNALSSQVK
jgi:hypothetical protein